MERWGIRMKNCKMTVIPGITATGLLMLGGVIAMLIGNLSISEIMTAMTSMVLLSGMFFISLAIIFKKTGSV